MLFLVIKEIWKIYIKGIFEEFRDNDIIVFGYYKCFKVEYVIDYILISCLIICV